MALEYKKLTNNYRPAVHYKIWFRLKLQFIILRKHDGNIIPFK
jgi:hypothetical protein